MKNTHIADHRLGWSQKALSPLPECQALLCSTKTGTSIYIPHIHRNYSKSPSSLPKGSSKLTVESCSQYSTKSLVRQFKYFLSCWKVGGKVDDPTYNLKQNFKTCTPFITNYFLYRNRMVLNSFCSLELPKEYQLPPQKNDTFGHIPDHPCCLQVFKTPQVIVMCSRGWESLPQSFCKEIFLPKPFKNLQTFSSCKYCFKHWT